MSTTLQKKRGIVWSFAESLLTQLSSFVISLFLARILTPTEYGTIGVCLIFINFINIFIEAGVINALIRKTDSNEVDYSTAFWFNLTTSILLYLVLFFSAPAISRYFESEILVWSLRVLGLSIIINAIGLVQNSILLRHYRMRQICLIALFSQITAGLVALLFAFKGFGVWALVVLFIVSATIKNGCYWVVGKWRPRFLFDRDSARYLWAFGSRMIGTRIINTFYTELYSFIIGKHLGLKDLGYYSNANTISQKPAGILNSTIQKMAVPIFSEYQNDRQLLRTQFVQAVHVTAFTAISVMAYLAVVGHPLILSIWTEKWAGAVMPFQILCFVWAFDPITTLNLNLLQATNHTGLIFKLEVVKKPIGFLILLLSLPFGFRGIVLGQAVYAAIAVTINTYSAQKVLAYSMLRQLCDVFKYVLLNIPGLTAAFLIITSCRSAVAGLILSFLADLFCIVVISALFKTPAYRQILQTITNGKYGKQ